MVPHPTATEIVKSMIKKIKVILTPAQKKRDYLLANNAHFLSQPRQSTFSHLQKILKFISQSGKSFSNPLKQYSTPKIAIN